MSVLITAASYAEAYKLERLLQLQNTIFADSHELPNLSLPGRKFLKIPSGSSASYAHEMLDIALNNDIERIFPLAAEELMPLAEARQLFLEYGISVMVPSVIWLKEQVSVSKVWSSQPVVIERGNVIAGKLPDDVHFPEENFSGVFYIASVDNKIMFRLFTA